MPTRTSPHHAVPVYLVIDANRLYPTKLRRDGTYFFAVSRAGNGDFHLVWYIGRSEVVSVDICIHAVLGIGSLCV